MRNVAKHARRILAATRKGAIGEKVFPGYLSFDEEARPTWWKDDLVPATWGRVLGVHENEPNTHVGAIVVTTAGLGVFGEGSDVIWLPYTSIEGWEKLSKDPVSLSLHVRTKTGGHIELLFPRVGEAFAFVQFLSSARREHLRSDQDQ